jgi:hypothetical protein
MELSLIRSSDGQSSFMTITVEHVALTACSVKMSVRLSRLSTVQWIDMLAL